MVSVSTVLPGPPVDAGLGLGPRSAAMLAEAGITDLEQLRAIGAVAAYVRVRARSRGASLNLLWALEGALTDRHWRTVARDDRTRLLLALDDLTRAGAVSTRRPGAPGRAG